MKLNQKYVKIGLFTLVVLLALGIIAYKQNWFGGEEKTTHPLYHFNENVELSSLLNQGKPVILDFTAEWCIPCRTFNPILEDLHDTYKDKIILKAIDVDKYPEFTAKYPIKVIPSQLVFNADGTPYQPDPQKTGIFGFTTYSSDAGSEAVTVHESAMSKEQMMLLLNELGVVE